MILDETGRDAGDAGSGDPRPEASRHDSGAGQGDSDFDPRFDPAFQRGYQPRPGEHARTRMRSAAPAHDESSFRRPANTTAPDAGGAMSAYRRASAESPVRSAPESDELSGDAGVADELREAGPRFVPDPLTVELEAYRAAESAGASGLSSSATRASFLDDIDVSPRRNPYFLALWLIGGGFVVLGIVLYVVSVYTSYSASSTASQDATSLVFSQIGWMLAGPLITVGLATLVALVLLSALKSRRAPAPAPDAPLSDTAREV
jgi:hypothetical protein